MAFHIKRQRPIAPELRRLARKEFRNTLEQLDANEPDEDAVHEARKSLKKIRAVLRLVEPEVEGYGEQNEQLRIAAHALAALRDADVTAETIEKLHRHYPTLISGHVATVLTKNVRRRSRSVQARAPRLLGRSRRIVRRMHTI